jgi:prolyl oligopeptidase
MRRPVAFSLLLLPLLAAALAACSSRQGPPETRRERVTDTYNGVAVTEEYRWLENWEDPQVRAWSDAQNAYARAFLDALPHREELRERVSEIMAARSSSYRSLAWREGRLFALKYEPPKQQSFLVVMPSPNEPEAARVLVDPNEMDAEGTTTIDWFVPSPNGDLVAVSLSKAGTESGDVSIFEVATGKRIHEIVPRVNGGTAGGDLAWSPNGKGFFYTRYPRAGERPPEDLSFYQQVYYHELGQPAEKDRYELGKDLPRIAEIQLKMDRESGRLLATVQKGDGGEFALFLRSRDGAWRQFSTFEDGIVQASFGPRDGLYLLSRRDAPHGKILRLPIAKLTSAEPRVIVSEGEDSIADSFMGSSSILVTDSLLFVEYQLGGPSEIRTFNLAGDPRPAPEQLPVSSVGGLTRIGADILFSNRSFIQPQAWYRYSPARATTEKTALVTESPVTFAGAEVVREFATSKDGTKVPVNIVMRKGLVRDGTHPCLVRGYGGYGISMEPRYRAVNQILLDHGVVYAIANLRGGGEYGEEWHDQGRLTKKQNVFDDFAAVLQHMIDRRYTNPEKLAIQGGSNGGLLMGATLVQHPELVKAVVSSVGIYDMLRVELSPNGAFNVPEFGTVQDPDQFAALYAYSPYHHVVDGTKYPAVLFLTGANDPRVEPMQSRKMTARLQVATGGDAPILLRTTADAGHGGGTALTERIEQQVDIFAFLFDEWGLEFRANAADDAPLPCE